MNTNILVTASALSDHDLLARLEGLAGKEREASAELVAHLAALDSRPALFAAQGYGSLFSYCTQALRLSEDAACNRIEAARACRRFPLILELLASGSLSLTSVRLLGRHLTLENHQSVLARARGRKRQEIEALVAELAPRPDVASALRKLPRSTKTSGAERTPSSAPAPAPSPAGPAQPSGSGRLMASTPSEIGSAIPPPPSSLPATPRPIVQALAPERYRVQFTIDQETHDKLRQLQALLRREVPDGDPGAIFDRALTVLLEKVAKTKLAATARTLQDRPIRLRTDRQVSMDKEARKLGPRSRHVPREVKREVWRRDGGQCAFVAPTGRRCIEQIFLEFHHVQPHAKQGAATIGNISLRCWRHNQYEAELVFGPHRPSIVRETRELFALPRPGSGRTIDV